MEGTPGYSNTTQKAHLKYKKLSKKGHAKQNDTLLC